MGIIKNGLEKGQRRPERGVRVGLGRNLHEDAQLGSAEADPQLISVDERGKSRVSSYPEIDLRRPKAEGSDGRRHLRLRVSSIC